jgi:hypothetical protein
MLRHIKMRFLLEFIQIEIDYKNFDKMNRLMKATNSIIFDNNETVLKLHDHVVHSLILFIRDLFYCSKLILDVVLECSDIFFHEFNVSFDDHKFLLHILLYLLCHLFQFIIDLMFHLCKTIINFFLHLTNLIDDEIQLIKFLLSYLVIMYIDLTN